MKKLGIIIIIFLAALLRFNQLNSLPALNADEAAIGYNAYSLLKTGKDEHGNPWPIHFQSFNDWKPGLYFYIVMPFVKVLGLNEWAVRIPGATLGVLTVFIVWLLVKDIFPPREWLPELSALFLAISPWHIHFSRGGWEVNAATFLITAGTVFFLKGLKNPNFYILSSIFYVLSLYTYHAARIVVPLLVIGLLIYFHHYVATKKNRKQVFLSTILGFLLLVPLAFSLFGNAGISRAAGVGLFSDTGPFWRINQQRGEHENFQGKFTTLLHNKPINYGLAFVENYARHFWGEFLFLSGDEIQRNRVPEMGQMYLVDFVFMLVGLFTIARNFAGWGPILIWLFTAPVAAALTFQSPHALRSQNMIIPLTIINAFGAWSLFNWLKSKMQDKKTLVTCYLLLVTFLFWDFTRYLHQYYVHTAKTYDFSSQYGVKELVNFVRDNQNKYSKIVVTDRYDQPYILFLFYLRYPPEQFQNNHTLTPRDKFGFSTVREFDKYVFRTIEPWDKIREEYRNSLIIGTDEEIPEAANILKTIYFPSGSVAFRVVAN